MFIMIFLCFFTTTVKNAELNNSKGIFLPGGAREDGACPVPSCSHIMGHWFPRLIKENYVLLYGNDLLELLK